MDKEKLLAWIRWFLFMEILILIFAVAGPGYRHAVVQEGDRGLLARFFIEDPTFLEAVGVNAVFMHVVIVGAWVAAWVVGKHREG